MKILAIETSCDETAICLLEARKVGRQVRFKVLGNALASQAKLHQKYGGVFPMLAKREHAKNLTPILRQVLRESSLLKIKPHKTHTYNLENVRMMLRREPELFAALSKFLPAIKKPKIDVIAVTYGPGLEPALWVGINFAKALSLAWNVPIVPVNHMEGHMFAALLQTAEKRGLDAEDRGKSQPQPTNYNLQPVRFPMLVLLISGGHTELVLSKKLGSYKIIGETRDDAVGEAFDKVARMLGLGYPGGPQISALAEIARQVELGGFASKFHLPRPMLHSGDFDFSFSGLKTAVLYTIRKIPRLTPKIKADVAREFEDAATEVLVGKTIRAAKQYEAKTVAVGGGVAANKKMRADLTARLAQELPDAKLYLPAPALTTDNALMIAVVACFRAKFPRKNIRAEGSLRL